MKKIRKAVIPAAGFGTRFLPATKAMPKEMIPVVDKPVIQYVVEDAVSAGIEDIIIVTGWHKRSIEDHFDYPFELVQRLQENGKIKQMEEVKRVSEMANFIYIRQKGPLGNATPIWNAREAIGDEPFIVLWGDEFFDSTPTRCQQLVAAYETYNCTILSAIKAPTDEDKLKWGYAAGSEIEPGLIKVNNFVEKPGPSYKDSDYAIIGGTVYTPDIFPAIEEATKRLKDSGENREIVYVDAVNILLEQGRAVYATELKNGVFRDTGTKINYLKTTVEVAAKRDDLGPEFREFLKEFVKTF
jgi:UTP--glucose-1-phosphate uridylyltransferase